MLAAHPMPF
jgi:hypothetical protein